MAVTKVQPEMIDGATAAGLALLAGATADAQLTALGLSTNAASFVKGSDYSTMRTLLGVLADTDKTTWTPALTFITPGNLSVAYSDQVGRYVRIGNLVLAFFSVITSTFTHTTATGALSVTGLPVAVTNTDGNATGAGFMQWQGITKASYTHMVPQAVAGGTLFRVIGSGSGQSVGTVTAADIPTGGTVRFIGCLAYLT